MIKRVNTLLEIKQQQTNLRLCNILERERGVLTVGINIRGTWAAEKVWSIVIYSESEIDWGHLAYLTYNRCFRC